MSDVGSNEVYILQFYCAISQLAILPLLYLILPCKINSQLKASLVTLCGFRPPHLPWVLSVASTKLPQYLTLLPEKMKTFKLELRNKWHLAPPSGHNGSVTSSSQSSDDSEEPQVTRGPRHHQRQRRSHGQETDNGRASYRSSSLPRHSSASSYRRSITMPNIKQGDQGQGLSIITNNYPGQYNNNPVGRDLTGQIDPIRGHNNNVQLTTWLQSLTGIPHIMPEYTVKENWSKISSLVLSNYIRDEISSAEPLISLRPYTFCFNRKLV